MTPPREVWVVLTRDGEALHAPRTDEDDGHFFVAMLDVGNPENAPHVVRRYVLDDAPRLLTDDQRQALAAALAMDGGIENDAKRHAIYRAVDDVIPVEYEDMARWLLAMDARGRG